LAVTFHELHRGDRPLLLPNAWDVASALAFLAAGYPAIGTTSFGVNAATGHPDGGRSMTDATARLARALAVLPAYVSVDVEDGYDDDPERVAAYVAGLGVAGVNIEDSTAGTLVAPAAHAEKIAAVKRHHPDVFVNARVDTYWLAQDATVEATLARATAYVEAGADGVFVPGLSDPDEVRAVTAALDVPVNLLVIPGRSLGDLAELGVRRVSTGSLPYRAAIDAAVAVTDAVRDGQPAPAATPYAEAQDRLVQYQRLRS
jgi:2-methylisocitrate lyase-like PEP mutase family enzyme